MVNELLKLVRSATEEDLNLEKSGLLKMSYSKMDTFINCPYSYKLKYEDGNYSDYSTLALEIGTLCHYVLEQKGIYIKAKESVPYTKLFHILYHGIEVNDQKTHQKILGVNDLKKKYWEEWGIPDNKSGMNYDQKIDLFVNEVIPTRIEEAKWEIVGTEVPFNFVYNEKVLFTGFIDRVDRNWVTNELRITDYKTSKAIYDDKKIKTPLQHVIYDLACVVLYNQIPTDHVYDFILLNKMQNKDDQVCSKGYLKRGIKKIDKTLKEIFNEGRNPHPTPLCYWCNFNGDTPLSDPNFKGMCQYNCLWTPTEKNFNVKNRYEENSANNYNTSNGTQKRKLIF